jgi:hypothetical protein
MALHHTGHQSFDDFCIMYSASVRKELGPSATMEELKKVPSPAVCEQDAGTPDKNRLDGYLSPTLS